MPSEWFLLDATIWFCLFLGRRVPEIVLTNSKAYGLLDAMLLISIIGEQIIFYLSPVIQITIMFEEDRI